MATYKVNPKFMPQFRKNVAAAVDRASFDMQSETKIELSKPGKGIKWPTLKYRSSKPGDPPTVQTGTLRRSIQVDRSNIAKTLTNRVGTNVKYAKRLELGDPDVDGMAARPYLVTALSRVRQKMLKRFARANLMRGIPQ